WGRGGTGGSSVCAGTPPPSPYLEPSLVYELLLRGPGLPPRTVAVPAGRREQRVGALRGGAAVTGAQRGTRPDGLSYDGFWSPWSRPATTVTPPDVDPVTLGLSCLLAILVLALGLLGLLGHRRLLQEKLWPPVPGPRAGVRGPLQCLWGQLPALALPRGWGSLDPPGGGPRSRGAAEHRGGGAAAAPPPPLGLLLGTDAPPLRIGCFAPRRFAGSTFELLPAGSRAPLRSIPAEPRQHTVEFALDGAAAAARCYRCRYRSYNGSAWETSELSEAIAVNGSGDAECGAAAAGTASPLPRSEPGGSAAAAPGAPRLLPLLALALLEAA
ncbi:erythropoietin receptor, partial [Amazona ochrocephala]